MPGIVGIIEIGSFEKNVAALDKMVKCMLHEPFYTSGVYTNKQFGLCVGWVNLPESFSDCMPVWNEARDICLIFSGENFADRSDFDYLRTRGHRFDFENASYLVHLYEELGAKFFEKLNGQFSGLVVDLRQKKVILFNDRYGLSRIYYHENNSAFYFASEAKALLKILPKLRELNFPSLGEFFSCGCPLQGKSLFSGISLLPGGAAWKFSQSQRLIKGIYFQREVWEKQEKLSGEDYYECLKETFSRILPRYDHGREKIGISLTGGLDTRMIMAWTRCPPGSLPSFTFAGKYRDCADLKLGRKVAEICGQPHQVIPVGNDFLKQFSSLAEKTVFITDGVMDMTGTPDLYVNKIVRQIAPVRLTGNYGGEILRSIVAFKPSLAFEGLLDRELSELLRIASETYFRELDDQRLSFVAFKQVPWHHYSRLSLERSQLTVRSPYLDNDLVALAFRIPVNLTKDNGVPLRLISDGNSALGRLGTDRGLLHHSVPFISRIKNLYQEFTFKAEYAYDYGMPQWLAKLDHHLLAPLHFEKLFLGRHKFYHFRVWYRDELSSYVKEILLDQKTMKRSYLNSKSVEKIVLDHTSGLGNYTTEISKLLTVELLQRQLIDQ